MPIDPGDAQQILELVDAQAIELGDGERSRG